MRAIPPILVNPCIRQRTHSLQRERVITATEQNHSPPPFPAHAPSGSTGPTTRTAIFTGTPVADVPYATSAGTVEPSSSR